MNYELNCTLMHPLMYVRDLDASPKRRGGRTRGGSRGSTIKRSRSAGSVSAPNVLDLELKSATSVMTRSQRKRQLSEQLALSESDTESEENDISTPQSLGSQGEGGSDETVTENGTLLNDLYISSDSSSSSSSSVSEMTAPSDTESEEDAFMVKAAEPLLGTLKGPAYFRIHKVPNLAVYEVFKATPITGDPLTVIRRFNQLCLDYPLDQAAILFVDKFKSLTVKKLISLLRIFKPLFESEFFSPTMSSDHVFGSIIMTLIFHWYERKLHQVNVKLLKLLTFYHIDPLKLHRFRKKHDDQLTNHKISNETEIGVLCCETFIATDGMKYSVKYLERTLRNAIEKNLEGDLEHLMPLVKALFSRLLKIRDTLPLTRLFRNIIDIQKNLEIPIDLTLYYDGVLAINVAQVDIHCLRRAFDLFKKVNYWGYIEASGIAYRGLLLVAAQLNLSQDRIADVFRMCVNVHAYPEHDASKWIISLYTSMSKVEIQIYLVQCLRAYLKEVWSQRLKMCRRYIIFKIVQVPNVNRNYLYPVHPKLIQIDNTIADAIQRLKMVIHYYMKTSPDSCLQPFEEDQLVMFHTDVLQLFKKALNVKSIEINPEKCVFCKKESSKSLSLV